MTKIQGISKSESWSKFDTIASDYDFLNTVLSCGTHYLWRKRLVSFLPKGKDLRILDCATGTGQVMFSMLKGRHADIRQMVGLDLAEEMMMVGYKNKTKYPGHEKLEFKTGSATDIPYEEKSYDCVTMAFGIRNVDDPQQCLKECFRVLKPGGRALIMEFSLPKFWLLKQFYLFYFRRILPVIGGLFSGDYNLYKYLNESVESFPYGDDFEAMMQKEGFQSSRVELTGGIATLYIGQRVDAS